MVQRGIRVVRPGDNVSVIFGAGDEYGYLATGSDTDGAYFLVVAIVPPGGGPPSHIQTLEEEAFYILEGEVSFYGEEGEIKEIPGAYLNIPKGGKHRFRNNAEEIARIAVFLEASRIPFSMMMPKGYLDCHLLFTEGTLKRGPKRQGHTGLLFTEASPGARFPMIPRILSRSLNQFGRPRAAHICVLSGAGHHSLFLNPPLFFLHSKEFRRPYLSKFIPLKRKNGLMLWDV